MLLNIISEHKENKISKEGHPGKNTKLVKKKLYLILLRKIKIFYII